jgi:hypothetical protein
MARVKALTDGYSTRFLAVASCTFVAGGGLAPIPQHPQQVTVSHCPSDQPLAVIPEVDPWALLAIWGLAPARTS